MRLFLIYWKALRHYSGQRTNGSAENTTPMEPITAGIHGPLEKWKQSNYIFIFTYIHYSTRKLNEKCWILGLIVSNSLSLHVFIASWPSKGCCCKPRTMFIFCFYFVMSGWSKTLLETITFWTFNLISLLYQSIFSYIFLSFQEIQFLRSSLEIFLLHGKALKYIDSWISYTSNVLQWNLCFLVFLTLWGTAWN